MSFFLSFLFWGFSSYADLSPVMMMPQNAPSSQRVMPGSRTELVKPRMMTRSRTGGGTVIILEDTHFKPTR